MTVPVGDQDEASGPAGLTGEDAAQLAVIHRPASDRILVDAGPGTGKTHVACSRVAALIDEGVPASRVWLISFTRTAVVEIRNRIAAVLGDPGAAAAVRIATLDSHAWALQSGFSVDADLNGGFDENIARTVERLSEDEDLKDYLGRVRHLVVDEAQDIVGVRAQLTLSIIAALEPDCGVTVFADEAQAIYGFTEDSETAGAHGPTLPAQLRGLGFEELPLTRVHRTSRPGLKTIFTSVRAQVIRRAGSVASRRRKVEHEIRRLADEDAGEIADLKLDAMPPGALVLMRNRADVLRVSSLHSETPHRLRMSGLPACIRPWVGMLLWDHTEARLTRSRFDELWRERIGEVGTELFHADAAWNLLFEVAGEAGATVDLLRLREVLGRASPPMTFCTPEFGETGPILGTIHASKGREADEVTLFLPQAEDSTPNRDPEEEIRVLFVGATRVREHLRVGGGADAHAGNAGGRSWRWLKPKRTGGKVQRRVQIEFGRANDLDAAGLVGKRTFATREEALGAQQTWIAAPRASGLIARAERSLDWDLVLEDGTGRRLAILSHRVTKGLGEIAEKCQRFPPPGFFPFLRSVGARTMVLKPEDPQLELLHEPWRSSGFLLAPLLTGYSPAAFPGS